LHRKFKDRGFAVLGFPCDQFGHQEPGDENEIKKFCALNYDVSFPLYAKIEVNGDNAHPLYKWLKTEKAGILGTEAIKWNFTKFLIDRTGRVLKRFAPNDTPEKLAKDVALVIEAPTRS
jgi:glutathione peroxidase